MQFAPPIALYSISVLGTAQGYLKSKGTPIKISHLLGYITFAGLFTYHRFDRKLDAMDVKKNPQIKEILALSNGQKRTALFIATSIWSGLFYGLGYFGGRIAHAVVGSSSSSSPPLA